MKRNNFKKILVIGCPGSGKSTLSRLIAGMLEPSEGSILIDGIDVRQIDSADIRNLYGVQN